MANQAINLGIGTTGGDTLYNGAVKINSNFLEIYSTLGDGNNIVSYAKTSGISTSSGYATIAGYSTSSGISTNSNYAVISGYSASSGISTLSTTSNYAVIAGYSTNSGIASYSGYSPVSGLSTTSGYAVISGYSTSSGVSTTSNYAVISGYSTSSGISTYAPTAGVSTSVIGGISSVTQLSVSGVSTLGITSTTNLTTQQLNVSGVSTFAGITTVTGVTLFSKQLNVSGVATITGNLNAAGNSYVKLARTSNQTITNGADALIGFSVVSDPNNWYSGITTRTTPTVAGTYRVDVMINWQNGSVANNQTNIQLRKNANTFALSQVGIQTNFAYTQTACGIVTMNGTTDYIDFTVYTANPTSQVVTGTADGAWTKMEIFKIN